VAPSGEVNHEVGAQLLAVVAGDRCLLGEVAVLDHPGHLHNPPKLVLTPASAHLWRAQRRHQLARLGSELLGAVAHVLDLLRQGSVRLVAALLRFADLLLDLCEGFLQRGDEGLDGLLALAQVGVSALALGCEPLGCECQQLFGVLCQGALREGGEPLLQVLLLEAQIRQTLLAGGPLRRQAIVGGLLLGLQALRCGGSLGLQTGLCGAHRRCRLAARQRASDRVAGSEADDQEDDGDEQVCRGHEATVPRGSDTRGQRRAGALRRDAYHGVLVALSIGIVGLPNVGKSTLFNALTRNDVLAANYPFATIEPNVGVVGVPDARLPVLAKLFDSARQVPATVSFVDIAGIVRGASEGAGLGNQFLSHIRESDAICQVIRAFDDPDVVHVDGRVDPRSDIETINTELILADLQTIERAHPRLVKEAKQHRDRAAVLSAVEEAQRVLEEGRTVFEAQLDTVPLAELFLLTAKPFLYVFNLDQDLLVDGERRAELAEIVAPAEAVFLDAQVEAELVELPAEEALELLQSVGQDESGLDMLARVGFDTLGLQTFLTAGPKESRAWTIPKGATAPQAAGAIHTDFQKGFIKAEIVSFDDLVDAGSMAQAKARGKVRMEGRDYVMADGDVVEFRFNV